MLIFVRILGAKSFLIPFILFIIRINKSRFVSWQGLRFREIYTNLGEFLKIFTKSSFEIFRSLSPFETVAITGILVNISI